MKPWEVLSSTEVYATPWIKVRKDEVVTHNNKNLTYSVVDLHSPSVFIIAINKVGNILLLQNYCYPIDKLIWDLPAGHSDGEDLLAAAKRELMEETGMQSNNWTELGDFYNAPGIGNIPGAAFLARNVVLVSEERDPDEFIAEQRFFGLAEVETMAKAGEIPNAGVLAALYLATLHDIQGE